jgi:hypothetical protein
MKSLSDELGGGLPTKQCGLPEPSRRWRLGAWLDEPVVTTRAQSLILACYFLFLLLERIPHINKLLHVSPLLVMLLLIFREEPRRRREALRRKLGASMDR